MRITRWQLVPLLYLRVLSITYSEKGTGGRSILFDAAAPWAYTGLKQYDVFCLKYPDLRDGLEC